MTVATISPARLAALCEAGTVTLLDVRTPAEYEDAHIPAARNVPLDRLDAAAVRSAGGETIYVVCRSGGRGERACQKLLEAGCANVVHVEGGTLAWEQAGLPVVRGRKAMSLERQVRIAAGGLVLLGLALGLLVHPALLGVAGVVGAGLVFAGVTDCCGMGLLLAKMPWNQRTPRPACSA